MNVCSAVKEATSYDDDGISFAAPIKKFWLLVSLLLAGWSRSVGVFNSQLSCSVHRVQAKKNYLNVTTSYIKRKKEEL